MRPVITYPVTQAVVAIEILLMRVAMVVTAPLLWLFAHDLM